MEFTVGVGKSDFEAIRTAGNYYVDKTELIYELAAKRENGVTLFTRPRRFGKTLTMSMLANFFDIRKDSRAIFGGLDIMRHEDFCREWMNQRPVLSVSLKDVEGMSFEDAFDMLRTTLADLCTGLTGIESSQSLNPSDKNLFNRLMFKTASKDDVKNSLKSLMRMLSAAFGRKVILLIDEYDVPLARASEKNTPENQFYANMLDVIRGMLSSSLKDNEFLEFAVVTGCLRIAKESIFTGTNNFASYSVIDERFSHYFGFTGEEVGKMLEASGLEDASGVIREWYDGYVFGTSHVYCPWDVISYLYDLRADPAVLPKNYWGNTSHNGILLSFVKRPEFRVKGKFEILMNGGTVTQTISDGLTYDTLVSSEDNLWSVLLMTGYVTKSDPSERGSTVSLRIPNREVAAIFQGAVARLFQDTVDRRVQDSLMDALWNGDEEAAGKAVSDLLWKTISYNDYHEDYYHAFLAGVFTGIGYEVELNKEKGLGRPDILLKDDDNRRVLIIEAKKSSREADMEGDCRKAIAQIAGQGYAEGLYDYGYTQVRCYGVAFFRKRALVRLG
ncbi:MAG: AAA family ATPase [Treponema sp.]|nr:AAA family ATPase [Treponema sp.]